MVSTPARRVHRYAENPPKRYEDIFPLDFETKQLARTHLRDALLGVVEFWIAHGISVFRVDQSAKRCAFGGG